MKHEPDAAPESSNADRQPTVLLVEDEWAMVRLMQFFFRQKGIPLLVAGDGVEGLEVATHAIPDLILTDLMLPHMDGRELRRRLLADPRTAHIPVMLTSAAATAEDAEMFTDVLHKPFKLDDLFERIRPYVR